MDFEKIRTDFEKRYGIECENIFFVGKKLDLFRENEAGISIGLTIGEALATRKRKDGRITLQSSGSDDITMFNVDSVEDGCDNRLAKLLKEAEKCGIKSGGADVLVFRNTRITDLFTPLVLGGLSAICENVPQKEKILPRFKDYAENIKTLSARKQCLTLFNGQKVTYLPFSKKYKVVIACVGDNEPLKRHPEKNSLQDAVMAAKKGDFEKFGSLLDKDTQRLLRNRKEIKAGRIYELIYSLNTALGSGIVDNNTVFSFVEDDKIDSFVHDVTSGYGKYFGGAPEFYITQLSDSGFFVKEF